MRCELVTLNEESIKLIDEAYEILLDLLDLDANEDFETLRQIANELENQDS